MGAPLDQQFVKQPGAAIAPIRSKKRGMMRLLLTAALTVLSIPAPAGPAQSDIQLCRAAIAGAERAGRVADKLMAAIGIVESGRRDPRTGQVGPWPWTINAEGAGQFFETKEQAIAAVQALQARGVRSIDVGCMQINLMYHPTAFATLEAAFDPVTNARYAARFLKALFARTADWSSAAAAYHSAVPERAEIYAQRVMAAWPNRPAAALAPKAGAKPSLAPGSFIVLSSGSSLQIVPLDDLRARGIQGLGVGVGIGRYAVQLTPR